MRRSCVSVLIACLGILFAATSVYAESVTVRVPADAPTDWHSSRLQAATAVE